MATARGPGSGAGSLWRAPAKGAYAYQPPGYGLPGQGMALSAPFGVDPVSGLPYSDKSKLAAGLLGIFLGSLGVGRFYMGNIGMGIAQIVVTFV